MCSAMNAALHFLRLAENLDASNQAAVELLRASTERLAAINGGDAEQAKAGALKLLWWLTLREA